MRAHDPGANLTNGSGWYSRELIRTLAHWLDRYRYAKKCQEPIISDAECVASMLTRLRQPYPIPASTVAPVGGRFAPCQCMNALPRRGGGQFRREANYGSYGRYYCRRLARIVGARPVWLPRLPRAFDRTSHDSNVVAAAS